MDISLDMDHLNEVYNRADSISPERERIAVKKPLNFTLPEPFKFKEKEGLTIREKRFQ